MPRLDDPEEFKIIKQIYFNDNKELTDEQDASLKRNKKQTNQAR